MLGLGELGESSLHMSVEYTAFLSGIVSCRGFIANWTFVVDASGSGVRKLLVVRESDIARFLMPSSLKLIVESREFAAWV